MRARIGFNSLVLCHLTFTPFLVEYSQFRPTSKIPWVADKTGFLVWPRVSPQGAGSWSTPRVLQPWSDLKAGFFLSGEVMQARSLILLALACAVVGSTAQARKQDDYLLDGNRCYRLVFGDRAVENLCNFKIEEGCIYWVTNPGSRLNIACGNWYLQEKEAKP